MIMRKLILALLGSVSSIALAQAQGVTPIPEPVPEIRGVSAQGPTLNGDRMIARQAQARPSSVAAGTPETVEQQKMLDSVPAGMPPHAAVLSADQPLTRNASIAVSAANRWANRVMKPRVAEDGRVHFPLGRAEPVVVCAVLHWCDIALQAGEVVPAPANIGDERWLAHMVFSGIGPHRVTHVVVKPSDAGLDSNLVIQTNFRTYSIRLLSTTKRYMSLVTFDYPEEDAPAVASRAGYAGGGVYAGEPCDQIPAIPDRSFRIGSGDALWRPTRVYAVMTPVGMKTCIQFPPGVASTRLPVLVAFSERGGWFSSDTYQAINFRYDPARLRYTVEGLLRNFDLTQGLGSDNQRIKVTQENTQ